MLRAELDPGAHAMPAVLRLHSWTLEGCQIAAEDSIQFSVLGSHLVEERASHSLQFKEISLVGFLLAESGHKPISEPVTLVKGRNTLTGQAELTPASGARSALLHGNQCLGKRAPLNEILGLIPKGSG